MSVLPLYVAPPTLSSPGRSQECDARSWRSCQDGIPETEGDAGVWNQLFYAGQRRDGLHPDSSHHTSRYLTPSPQENTTTVLRYV